MYFCNRYIHFIVLNNENFTIQQVFEALREIDVSETPENNDVDNLLEEQKKNEEEKKFESQISAEIPKTENCEEMREYALLPENLRNVPSEEFSKNSNAVLTRKLQIHFPHLVSEEELKTNITKEKLSEFLNKLFMNGNFTINTQEELKNGNITANIDLIAENLCVKFNEMPESPITLELLDQEILSFINSQPTDTNKFLVIDLNNELQFYHPAERNAPQPTPTPSQVSTHPIDPAFIQTLKQTIQMYENLLNKQRENNEDFSSTENLLNSLKSQLVQYTQQYSQNDRSFATSSISSKKNPAALQEKRKKGLQEIFKFYTKQRALAHVRKTFDTVQNELESMCLGYYLKFLKDFEISLEMKVFLIILTCKT